MINNQAELSPDNAVDGFAAVIVNTTIIINIPESIRPPPSHLCNQRQMAGIKLYHSNVDLGLYSLYRCPFGETINYVLAGNNHEPSTTLICTFPFNRAILDNNRDLYPLLGNLSAANPMVDQGDDYVLHGDQLSIQNWDRNQENDYIRFSVVVNPQD